MSEAIPDFADNSQIVPNDFPDQAKAVAKGDAGAVRPKRTVKCHEAFRLLLIVDEKVRQAGFQEGVKKRSA